MAGKLIRILTILSLGGLIVVHSRFRQSADTVLAVDCSAQITPDRVAQPDATVPAVAPIPPQSVSIVVDLPKNAVLMIASLDQCAAKHSLRVERVCAGSTADCLRDAALRNDRDSSVFDFRIVDLRTSPLCCVPSEITAESPTKNHSKSPFAVPHTDISVANDGDQRLQRRRFVVPEFHGSGFVDRPVIGHLLFQGESAQVYAVDGLTSDENDLILTSQRVVELYEKRIGEVVNRRIGRVNDADGDSRLTFVLCNLSRDETSDCAGADEPILGCVRAADYSPESANPCDVVYLHCSIRGHSELEALLAHELTHAATFSRLANTSQSVFDLPVWLNEAIAHCVERQVSAQSSNLKNRLQQYCLKTSEFPIVVPDHGTSLSMRRGPARAAGCLFLETVLANLPSTALEELISCQGSGVHRLEQVSGRSFPELMRNWSLNLLSHSENCDCWNLPLFQPLDLTLTGTAVTWSLPSEKKCRVRITAAAESQLQITVVESGSR